MPGRVSKAIRKAVRVTILKLLKARKGGDADNPYKPDTYAYNLFERQYKQEQEKWKQFEWLHDDMMQTMYGVLPYEPWSPARLPSKPTKLPPNESPSNDGDSIRSGGSVCFAIPDRISDGGDTE